MRVTKKHLIMLVDRINRTMGTPEDTHRKEGDRYVSNVGNYHLDSAYGGWDLQQTVNEGGGVISVFNRGHIRTGQLYDLMHAFLAGVEHASLAGTKENQQ